LKRRALWGLACLAALGLDEDVLGLDEDVLATGAKIHHLYGCTAKERVIFDISYRGLHPNRFGLGIHRGARYRQTAGGWQGNAGVFWSLPVTSCMRRMSSGSACHESPSKAG